jgi:hypothetical protein
MIAFALCAMTLCACGDDTRPPGAKEETPVAATEPAGGTRTITGVLSLAGQACDMLSAGFTDVPGSRLGLKDESGAFVANTRLPARRTAQSADGQTTCDFAFSLENVPASASYTFETCACLRDVSGSARRGTFTFTSDQLEANAWHADLDLVR